MVPCLYQSLCDHQYARDMDFDDVRLLSLTAIKGWKSQHWFIWRVLSPSGPFQALNDQGPQ